MPVSMIKWCKLWTHTGNQLSCALGLQGHPPIFKESVRLSLARQSRSVSGQGRNLASWLKRTSRTLNPAASRHCPMQWHWSFAVLGFAAPVLKTKPFLKSIIFMGWGGGFIESVWECYVILGVSVFRERSNLNLFSCRKGARLIFTFYWHPGTDIHLMEISLPLFPFSIAGRQAGTC